MPLLLVDGCAAARTVRLRIPRVLYHFTQSVLLCAFELSLYFLLDPPRAP